MSGNAIRNEIHLELGQVMKNGRDFSDYKVPVETCALSWSATSTNSMPRGRAMIAPDGARPSPCEPPIEESRFPAPKKPVLREPLCLVRFELRCGKSCASPLGRPDVQVPSSRSKHKGSTSQGCPCLSKRRTPYHGTQRDLLYILRFWSLPTIVTESQ